MKITKQQESPKFQPISITFTIENEEELEALKALSSCETSASTHVLEVIHKRRERGEVWDFKYSVLVEILLKLNRIL